MAGKSYEYFSLPALAEQGFANIKQLPYSLKVLLENLLRYQDERTVTVDDVKFLANWQPKSTEDREIALCDTAALRGRERRHERVERRAGRHQATAGGSTPAEELPAIRLRFRHSAGHLLPP